MFRVSSLVRFLVPDHHRLLHGRARSYTSHSTSALADVRPVSGAMKLLLMNCFTVYCNSLLVTLNARKGLAGGSRSDDTSLCQGTQRMTKLGASSTVGFLRDGVGHGLIILSAHAK